MSSIKDRIIFMVDRDSGLQIGEKIVVVEGGITIICKLMGFKNINKCYIYDLYFVLSV